MKTRWEQLPDIKQLAEYAGGFSSHRLEVPGGWLVVTAIYPTQNSAHSGRAVTQSFIADPDHRWKLREEVPGE